MTVYVLFHETNTGRSDPSDGYIEAIYEHQADAEAARIAGLCELRDAGYAIYCDPDTGREDEHWEHDLVVEAHDVIPQHSDALYGPC